MAVPGGFHPEGGWRMRARRALTVCGLAFATCLALAFVAAPGARAYGDAIQWQIGFSGTFNSVPRGGNVSGFWGWCVYGGSPGGSSVGTARTTGDCQFANYFGIGRGMPVNTFAADVSVTGWAIEAATAHPVPGVSQY